MGLRAGLLPLRVLVSALLLLPGGAQPAVAATPATLRIATGADGAPAVSAAADAASVVILERSTALGEGAWTETLRAHGAFESVADLTAGAAPRAFYRALTRARTATDDWKNLVRGDADEPFQSEALPSWSPGSRWIKFAILLDDPQRVYFQDSGKYEFHYDFARVRLAPFAGITREAFDAATLHTNGQRAVLGAVLFPPFPSVQELGIQLIGLEPYEPGQVASWFRTVRARIQAPAGTTFYYLPAFEQAEVARRNREWLESQGVLVSSPGRWVTGDECYAPGWALGRLVRVAGDDIAAAYREGRLLPDDILLTDAVPAEVPPLAGIIAGTPATPNSHVALLARSFDIPFVHVATPALADAVQGWTNRDVVLRAVSRFGGCELTLAPVEGTLPAEFRTNILALHAPPVLHLPARTARGQYSLPADGLHPADIVFVGGKAANFGVLRRRLPGQSPTPSLALTFDLWDAFLDQDLPGGRTLRAAIQGRLAAFQWPPDMAALETALTEVRDWITDTAEFSPALRAAVLEALQGAGFEPARKIRFRSSTNVEDGQAFSGAGLQDSYSGCLADDLDADATGPSLCDPTESKERGVFRALQKVYASFYNANAYRERLRHHVDETTVGMGVLVHPSSPDDIELANGVATLRFTKDTVWYANGNLVTQAGAVSVANPDSTAVPETVSVSQFGTSLFLGVSQRSSLVPLGGSVMPWESAYRSLVGLLTLAAQGWASEFPGRSAFDLDFEYKRLAPDGRLQVKQIREIPAAPEVKYIPWLMAVPTSLEVVQGEYGDVIAKHRLKSTWRLLGRTVRLADANLSESPIARLEVEGVDGGQPFTLMGAPSALPEHRFSATADALTDRFTAGAGKSRRTYGLELTRIRETTSAEGPLVVLGDHAMFLNVTYATPQPTLAYDFLSNSVRGSVTTNESVRLGAVVPVSASSLRQDRAFKSGRLQVTTSFWWPSPPTGPVAGYTAPLQGWIETRLEGLASRPLVLHSAWAQTYAPGHHNFVEEYAFEPRLDPDVPTDLLAELAAANIRAVVVSDPRGDFGTPVAFVWGLDDTFRKL